MVGGEAQKKKKPQKHSFSNRKKIGQFFQTRFLQTVRRGGKKKKRLEKGRVWENRRNSKNYLTTTTAEAGGKKAGASALKGRQTGSCDQNKLMVRW